MWVVSDKMVNEYIEREPFKLPFGAQIVVAVAYSIFLAYAVLPNWVEGWNYELMDKQAGLTEKFERKIEGIEGKYVVGGDSLDSVVWGEDGG